MVVIIFPFLLIQIGCEFRCDVKDLPACYEGQHMLSPGLHTLCCWRQDFYEALFTDHSARTCLSRQKSDKLFLHRHLAGTLLMGLMGL